jgi:hypothetical protein
MNGTANWDKSLEADTASQQALPYSGGLPHLFGVPHVEGDATSTIHITTLVARLDFTNIPETSRLQLPTHRSTLLSVLHRALQDTLLHKYDQGLVPLEITSARILTPSHRPSPSPLYDHDQEQNATDEVAPDDPAPLIATIPTGTDQPSHKPATDVHVLVRLISLPQTHYTALRVSGYHLYLARPGAPPDAPHLNATRPSAISQWAPPSRTLHEPPTLYPPLMTSTRMHLLWAYNSQVLALPLMNFVTFSSPSMLPMAPFYTRKTCILSSLASISLTCKLMSSNCFTMSLHHMPQLCCHYSSSPSLISSATEPHTCPRPCVHAGDQRPMHVH